MDAKVMKAVHGLHVFWNVQPQMSEVIKWFYYQHVAPEGAQGTFVYQRVVSKEHSWEDDLKANLCPHVKHNSNQIVVFLTFQLFLRQFVGIVILIAEKIVQSKQKMGGEYTCYACDVHRHDWGQLEEECWNHEQEQIILGRSLV